MKAVALLSGGLDSMLATEIIVEQGIEVTALNFTSPFCLCSRKGKCYSAETAKRLGIPFKVISKGVDYLKIIRKPKHGYGSGMNPCIDCRIFMLKKAKKFAKSIGAKFLFTGEVLGQRPMSQHMAALNLIEKEAGLQGKLLRPLSAKLLPETEAEKKGWVDRNKLLEISGRRRNEQINLTKKYNIKDYPCPAGGCLLTQKEFAAKLKDLFKHKKNIAMQDIELLKIGRHFRSGENKIIVGRNEAENNALLKTKLKSDYFFEIGEIPGPVTILQGRKTKEAIKSAAMLTARYSDAKQREACLETKGSQKQVSGTLQKGFLHPARGQPLSQRETKSLSFANAKFADAKQREVKVNFGKEKLNKQIIITAMQDKEIDKLRI